MEIYIHKFRCGHQEEITLYGDVQRQKNHLALSQGYGLCPECKRKAFVNKYARMTQVAAQRSAENGYPTLIGTIKQVLWANTIREKAVMFFKAKAKFFDNADKAKQIMHELKDLIDNKTDASFWIENRARFVVERTNYR